MGIIAVIVSFVILRILIIVLFGSFGVDDEVVKSWSIAIPSIFAVIQIIALIVNSWFYLYCYYLAIVLWIVNTPVEKQTSKLLLFSDLIPIFMLSAGRNEINGSSTNL